MQYIEFPESIKKIGEMAFCYTGLKNVELPEGLIYLGGEVFMGAMDLEEVKFPKSLQYIDAEGYLFDECIKLNKIKLPESFHLDIKYESGVIIEYY